MEESFGKWLSPILPENYTILFNPFTRTLATLKTVDHLIFLQRKTDDKLTFSDLPHDCVLRIFATIPDHTDIIHMGQTNKNVYLVANDKVLWKQMCLFHFSHQQLLVFVQNYEHESQIDWKYIYRRCFM